VLVDAPCSSLGRIRRHPEIKWNKHPQSIKEMHERQKEILVQAARCVKPGGLLLYATCTMLPDENEAVIAAFLHNRSPYDLQGLVSNIISSRNNTSLIRGHKKTIFRYKLLI
jgi:16S rRNA (cytosine967-C5)-methyltransferase